MRSYQNAAGVEKAMLGEATDHLEVLRRDVHAPERGAGVREPGQAIMFTPLSSRSPPDQLAKTIVVGSEVGLPGFPLEVPELPIPVLDTLDLLLVEGARKVQDRTIQHASLGLLDQFGEVGLRRNGKIFEQLGLRSGVHRYTPIFERRSITPRDPVILRKSIDEV